MITLNSFYAIFPTKLLVSRVKFITSTSSGATAR